MRFGEAQWGSVIFFFGVKWGSMGSMRFIWVL